jgi:hypothetical protein
VFHRDVYAVHFTSSCVHVGRSCRCWFRQLVHWQTTCLLRYLQSTGRGRVPEGPGVSPAAMKTRRSGVPRPDSVVATSVGEFSSVGASGVPS